MTTQAPPRWLGGIGEAFADGNFRIYSIGSVFSWMTYFIQEIAFSWATWEATHSPFWLAAVSLLTVGATVALVPIGGAVADRRDRFQVALAAYACDAVKAVALTALALAHRLDLPLLCAAALLHGIIHSFSIPAAYGLMPRFVAKERLSAAIGVSAAYTQFAVFAGPAAAGWLIVHGGVAAAFGANVAGYLVFFATAAMLRTPPDYSQPKLPPRSLRRDIAEGVDYLRRHPGLRPLLAVGLASDAVSAAVYRMAPAVTGLVFAGGPALLAWFYGAAGLGATVSALWIAHGGARRATPGRVVAASLGIAAAVALLGIAPTAGVAVVSLALFGFAAEMRRTGTVAIVQSGVDDAKRGRVLSTVFVFGQVAGGLGTLAVGLSASGPGLRVALVAAAAGLAAVWLFTHRRRRDIAAAFGPAAR